MPGTLTIGDFAHATHLSVKALRHYHEFGLLIPAQVEPSSGYRRYTTEQVASALVIRRFRELDMPLDDIAGVLGTDDMTRRNELITGHLERLERRLGETQRAVRSLRELLGSSGPASIEVRSVPAMLAAAITAVVDVSELGMWLRGAFGELDATVAAQRLAATGPAGGVYDGALFEDERGSATVYVPVAAPVEDVGRVHSREIPAVDLATTIHRGDHDDIDVAYGSLATYVADHAISLDGSIRETYIAGFREGGDTARWVTEIGWPVFNPGRAEQAELSGAG